MTNGLVDIAGEVVGPYRMPRPSLSTRTAHPARAAALPNARTMARDAAVRGRRRRSTSRPYDNDGNGFVDAFIVVHAGARRRRRPAAPATSGRTSGCSRAASTPRTTRRSTRYLTVPEDAKIGVCAHELGHLLFGFPDLYDTDGASEGIGNWCLMAGGSWNGGGDIPAHPSAWCKANQGWVTVNNVDHERHADDPRRQGRERPSTASGRTAPPARSTSSSRTASSPATTPSCRAAGC